jgi:hypothetical protein
MCHQPENSWVVYLLQEDENTSYGAQCAGIVTFMAAQNSTSFMKILSEDLRTSS